MVDVERLSALLDRVVVRLDVLDDYADLPPAQVLPDRRSMNDVKYTFQTAIEACLDAALHVIASEQLGRAETNAGAFRRLGDAGVLEDGLARVMASAVGFRNVLVHGYADVDDEQVLDNLRHLPELREYVAVMADLAT